MFPLRTLALTLVCFTAVSGAVATQKRQALAKVVTSCVKPNQVALTFDDGPYFYNCKIAQTLKDAGAVGTFFVNGHHRACIYDEDRAQDIKNAYDMGHQISSHTWAHKDLTTLSSEQINDEMQRLEQALEWIIGAKPAMMRLPYGSYNDLVRQVSQSRGQTIIYRDLDTGDTMGATVAQSEALYDDAIAKHATNILALMHETHETTADEVLPYAIQKLQAAGYKLVSVAECTGLPAYQWTGSPSPRNSSWHC